MKIRRFKKEDSIKTANLIKKCLLEINNKDYSDKIINSMLKENSPSRLIEKSKERSVFVASKNEKILGTVSIKEDEILSLFVNPNNHGKGIGSILMDRMELIAKTNKYKMVKLNSSITAFEFYKQRKYTKNKISHSKEFGDTFEMKKKL